MSKHSNLCTECGNSRDCVSGHLFTVDGKNICRRCLFGNARPIEIYPIGFVNNNLQRDNSKFAVRGEGKISKVELFDSQERFMYRLEDEKFLTIVYHLHKSRSVKSIFKRGLDNKKVGIFASRTPDRLSGIGIQDVKLIKIERTTLHVEGLDAINGTPVLDIKLCWHKKYDKESS